MITVMQFFELKLYERNVFKIIFEGQFLRTSALLNKIYLKTWKKYVLPFFYIFKYILKITFIYNVLFFLILYICIIIFKITLKKTIKRYFEYTKISIFLLSNMSSFFL